MTFFKAVKEELGNLIKLLNPYEANKFFDEMQVKSANYILAYLIFIGSFLFAGYYLNFYYKAGFEAEIRCSFITSLESAFLTYITIALIPSVAGSIISLFGKNLAGRDITSDEIISMIGYSTVLILASGIFRAHIITSILHYISIAYGIYLLYVAISVRFGFDRAILCFLFFLIIISIVLMSLSLTGNTMLNLLVWIGQTITPESPLRQIPPWCH